MAALRELQSAVESVKMFSTNLQDQTKRVVISINGERYTLSPKLSDMLRKKEITLSELGDFEVRTVEAQDGTTFNSLGLPGEDLEIKIAGWKSGKVAAAKVVSEAEFEQALVF